MHLGARTRFLRRAIGAAITVAILSVGNALPSAEAATYPGYATSWYVTDYSTTRAYNEGCALGTAVGAHTKPQQTLVVLNFFSQYYSGGWGTRGLDLIFHPISAAEAYAHEWARGWYLCTGSDSTAALSLAMGTRNIWAPSTLTLSDITTRGHEWAQVADDTNTGLGVYGSQVTIVGAIDAEVGWADPTVTLDWANAYSSMNLQPYYNYGDAAGCPPYGSCSPYTQSQIYDLSYGISAAFALPEIYTASGSQADEWQAMSVWGYLHGSLGRIHFTGTFTQQEACAQPGHDCSGSDPTDNSPSTGWDQLWTRLSGDSRTTDQHHALRE